MSNLTLGEWLKRETRSDHAQVDQHPVLKPLLKRDLTLPDYTTALTPFMHRLSAWKRC